MFCNQILVIELNSETRWAVVYHRRYRMLAFCRVSLVTWRNRKCCLTFALKRLRNWSLAAPNGIREVNVKTKIRHKQAKQHTYKCNIEARLPNHCCRGKTISISNSEFASQALVIQHARRMHHIILSSVVCPNLPHFSKLSHKRYFFRKNIIENKMFTLIIFTSFVCNNSHSKKIFAKYCHKFHKCSSTLPVIVFRF
jgi:hypothetical protein